MANTTIVCGEAGKGQKITVNTGDTLTITGGGYSIPSATVSLVPTEGSTMTLQSQIAADGEIFIVPGFDAVIPSMTKTQRTIHIAGKLNTLIVSAIDAGGVLEIAQ